MKHVLLFFTSLLFFSNANAQFWNLLGDNLTPAANGCPPPFSEEFMGSLNDFDVHFRTSNIQTARFISNGKNFDLGPLQVPGGCLFSNSFNGATVSTTMGTGNSITSSVNCIAQGDANNMIECNNSQAFGQNNSMTSINASIISGGNNNMTQYDFSSILGYENTMNSTGAVYSGNLISGNDNNMTDVVYSGIFGQSNTMTTTTKSFVAGGLNTVDNSDYISLFGKSNSATINSDAIFVGGEANTVSNSVESGIIGELNSMTNAHGSFIGGGHNTLIGGKYNQILGDNCHVDGAANISVGGHSNVFLGSSNFTFGTSLTSGQTGIPSQNVFTFGRAITNIANNSMAFGFPDAGATPQRTMTITEKGVGIKMSNATNYVPTHHFEANALQTAGPNTSNIQFANLPTTTNPTNYVVRDPVSGELFNGPAVGIGGNAWLLTGNNGVLPTDYIGTINNEDFRIHTGNTPVARHTWDGGNFEIGNSSTFTGTTFSINSGSGNATQSSWASNNFGDGNFLDNANYSTNFGNSNSISPGDYDFTFGLFNSMQDGSYNMINGLNNSMTSTFNSFTSGSNNNTNSSTHIGSIGENQNFTSAKYGFSAGLNNTVTSSDHIYTMGESNTINNAFGASSNHTSVIGSIGMAKSAEHSSICGYQNTLNRTRVSHILGSESTIGFASGTPGVGYSVILGNNSSITSDRSFTIGNFLTANATSAFAFGNNITNTALNSMAFGFPNALAVPQRVMTITERGTGIKMNNVTNYIPGHNLEVNAAVLTGQTVGSNIQFTNLPITTSNLPVIVVEPNGELKQRTLTTATGISSTCSTLNFIPKVGTGGSPNLTCSQIFDNGTGVGIGTTATSITVTAANTVLNPTGGLSSLTPGTYGVRLNVNGIARATQFLAFSDMNLKANIKPIQNASQIISKLEGKTYNWNEKAIKEHGADGGLHVGFIAQELEKIIPEVVAIDENGQYAVNYLEIIPILVESQKETMNLLEQEKIKLEQEKIKNEKLQNELNSINSKLDDLYNSINACCAKANETGTEIKDEIKFKVYPNPASKVINTEQFIPYTTKKAEVIISDLNGKVIKTVLINCTGICTVSIELHDISSNLVICSLFIDDKKVSSQKVGIYNN